MGIAKMIKSMFALYSYTITKKDSLRYKVIRFFIKHFLNYYIPLYYFLCNKKMYNTPFRANIVVSLTTFPKRIGKTWIVIESILHQTVKPKKIVLVLSKLQFESEESLPKRLLQLKKYGLEIIWTEDDIRSHKKYYHTMKKYPNDVVVTIDDDFIYEKNMLKKLVEFHAKYPNCIVTNFGLKKIGLNYHDWENLFFKQYGPSQNIMQFGGSGVLYPPNSLHSDALNQDYILKYCPLADDLWLNAMALLNNVNIVKTDYSVYLLPIIFKGNLELYSENVLDDKNNEQIAALERKYGRLFDME